MNYIITVVRFRTSNHQTLMITCPKSITCICNNFTNHKLPIETGKYNQKSDFVQSVNLYWIWVYENFYYSMPCLALTEMYTLSQDTCIYAANF